MEQKSAHGECRTRRARLDNIHVEGVALTATDGQESELEATSGLEPEYTDLQSAA
jgi:hypothetical protein